MAVGRRIVAVVGGVVAAGVVVALVEATGHALGSGEVVFAIVVLGYLLGALVGTGIAAMIADRRAAIAVPVLLAALAAANLFAFAHPVWFAPTAAVALVLGWGCGSSLSHRWSRREQRGRPVQ